MTPADLKDILGDTYNDYFFNNGSNYSKILESEGILIFNSFINRKGLINLQKEAADLKYLSYKSSSEYNVYVSEYDNSFPDDSPRNRIMSTSKKCVPNDLIPRDSILQTLYNSKAIRSFFMDLLRNRKRCRPCIFFKIGACGGRVLKKMVFKYKIKKNNLIRYPRAAEMII